MSEEFYDGEGVRDRYLEHRRQRDNPNDAIERPAFLALAGSLQGLAVLDLGCGDARFGREALEAGAHSYLGIEASEGMAAIGRKTLEGTSGVVEHMPIESWQPAPEGVDLVTSRLALNHVENLAEVFRNVHAALRPGGRLVVSVEHPVITSNFASLEGGRRTTWLVDNYFQTGARPHMWMGHEVVKYHRTFDDYVSLIQESGLVLEAMRESRPARANFHSEEEYPRRLRIPLFLFLSARKQR
ncbi:MAG TPA: class I SAM-dependent methyltransferase [Trueperaceae bacterium]